MALCSTLMGSILPQVIKQNLQGASIPYFSDLLLLDAICYMMNIVHGCSQLAMHLMTAHIDYNF